MKRQHFCCIVFSLSVASASADTTVNATNHYAYGANIGWVDARGDVASGAVLGQLYCTGYLWGANVGWIGLGNGPANGWHYANASGIDWGVNHDGAGNLTGYAYGANIGWITFEQTYGQPKIDLLAGKLRGSVWGANVGWISLSNAFAHVQSDTLAAGPDSDSDGIPDAWEYRMAESLRVLGADPADFDGDSVPDAEEYRADTDPLDRDNALAITGFARAVDTNTVTWLVMPTRHYRLMEAHLLTNGSPWSDSGYGLMVPGTAPTLTRTMSRTNSASFFRVQAVIPLSP